MDTLESMKVFVRVAQRAGFAPAARELRMSPASVTKHVAAIEERLSVRLFDRTTRHVALTEAGRLYLERCLECLQAFDDADASVTALASAPQGVLRVTAPIDMQRQIAATLGRFAQEAPQVTVDLQLSNRAIDLVDEGVDVAIRVAPALDGQYVARPLATLRLAVVGSPDYFRKHGRPKKPADLERHRAVVFAEPRPRVEWLFKRGDSETRAKLQPALLTNGGDAIATAVADGVGLTIAPSFVLGDHVAAGRLEAVLLDWTIGPALRVFAVYPHRRFLSPKVRVYVDTLRAMFGDGTTDPWWPAEPSKSRQK